MGGGGRSVFFFSSLFPVQQATSAIGHRVKQFFRVGNQCAECEKQQQGDPLTLALLCDHELKRANEGLAFDRPIADLLYRLINSFISCKNNTLKRESTSLTGGCSEGLDALF